LASDEAIAIFMAEAFQTKDAGCIAHALGVVARAKGMAQIAGQTGLSREQLYRSAKSGWIASSSKIGNAYFH
jgi:probable addiction module antidote protein